MGSSPKSSIALFLTDTTGDSELSVEDERVVCYRL